MTAPIKKVVVVGASCNLGRPIVSALLAAGFNVSALTRQPSLTHFPPSVKAISTDYTASCLLVALRGQDAVISAVAIAGLTSQTAIIDAAVAAGVRRFIPAEFGCDTAPANAADVVPPLAMKKDVVSHLRSKEADGLSWTSICCGMWLDWIHLNPYCCIENNEMFFDVAARRYTTFGAGTHPFIVSTLSRTASTVAAVLLPANYPSIANRYIYTASFTLTQTQLLAHLEVAAGGGEKFQVCRSSVEELAASGLGELAAGDVMGGLVEIVPAGIYGYGGLNEFSEEARGWGERLGLDSLREDLGEVVGRSVRRVLVEQPEQGVGRERER